jgi:lipopolysaccharide cholinephosphotransferase
MLCHQYSLNYFLIGGSLLGAVRHQGFIPWDDDLDVGMPREDYNRFLKVAPVVLSHSAYFLQTPFTDRNYGLSYAKLIDTETQIEEYNNMNHAKKGLFIDIFPFDQISPSSGERTSQMAKLKLLDGSILVRLGYHIVETPLSQMARPLTVKQYNAVRTLKHKREALMQAFSAPHQSDAAFKNLASQYGYDKEILSADEMTHLTPHLFEHLTVNIPTAYDVILTRMYGNYQQLPNANQQVPKHFKHVSINNDLLF